MFIGIAYSLEEKVEGREGRKAGRKGRIEGPL